MTSTILHAKVRRPENKLAGVVLSRRRSCRRTILQPRRFVFAAEVRTGRPDVGVCFPRRFAGGREDLAREEVRVHRGGNSPVAAKLGVCFPRRFAGGREGPARLGASACRGGSCSPWRFAGGREGWRVLPAKVRRRPRRSRCLGQLTMELCCRLLHAARAKMRPGCLCILASRTSVIGCS